MLAKYNYLVPASYSVVTSAVIFTVSDTAPLASICSQNIDDGIIITIPLKMEKWTDAVQKEISHLNSFFSLRKNAKLLSHCFFPHNKPHLLI